MTNPATDKQKAFIRTLADEREVGFFDASPAVLDNMTTVQASAMISLLQTKPRRVNNASAPSVHNKLLEQYAAALDEIPHSKYAIPVEEIQHLLTTTKPRGDLLFLETKSFKGRAYLRQLHGAPGDFTRTRIAMSDAVALLAVLATDPKGYAILFGKHYKCCGRCAAPLTDPESRRLFLGPTCRNVWR